MDLGLMEHHSQIEVLKQELIKQKQDFYETGKNKNWDGAATKKNLEALAKNYSGFALLVLAEVFPEIRESLLKSEEEYAINCIH